MARPRRSSNVSNSSSMPEQELSSMYDYLAKIILLGPSGSGKSCLLHRFLKHEWRALTSHTIGVEFASRIIRIGPPPHAPRIKLQLWDTAGTERFRSVSRSYYRGAAGAILVYDISSRSSFTALPDFLNDARALASRDLVVVLAGNKSDLAAEERDSGGREGANAKGADNPFRPTSNSRTPSFPSLNPHPSYPSNPHTLSSQLSATRAPGREISPQEPLRWASSQRIPVAVEVSAYTGEGVEDIFTRLARIILTKIELGEIDPGDPRSGVQFGDSRGWEGDEGALMLEREEGASGKWRRERERERGSRGVGGWLSEWGEVFGGGGGKRGGGGCC